MEFSRVPLSVCRLMLFRQNLFKIQAFGLFDELDFLEVCEGVHKVRPDGRDGVTVYEGFDVDDF